MSVPEDRIAMVGSEEVEEDFEASEKSRNVDKKGVGTDFTKKFNRSLSGERLSGKTQVDRDDEDIGDRRDQHEVLLADGSDGESTWVTDALSDEAPPEWALLLVGCLLGLTTGICVAAFNHVVHVIHEWAWAGTPNEGATWLRLQKLEDTWHRILLIPLTGGLVVGMMHGLLEIFEQIKKNGFSSRPKFDCMAGIFPTVKALQAAVCLGTGCSLGPEGPSVDIGKSCANGCLKMMENNRERKIAFVAAGAAAGISSGFNAAVAGCFFAIETVLRPLQAENSPPFTTATIILASVISSTVSNVLSGEKQAFTVPTYELKSAAELPLYLILGMLCGAVSLVFARLVTWFTNSFEYIKNRFELPAVVCPALGGLGAGIIALRYPGILYWGFTNVDEILHTGKSASAPGLWLLAQLTGAKVVATTLCKGSGLVGGLYAPSLMIGAAVGAVFGGSAAKLLNSAIPGNGIDIVAQPQAYALVGMAATLASVCSVPLTSILLLFELTKDYRILLPLMGAVGLAIWVPSLTNLPKDNKAQSKNQGHSSSEEMNRTIWKQGGNYLHLSIQENSFNHEHVNDDAILDELKVSDVMSKNFARITSMVNVKEAMKFMNDTQQKCVVVVDAQGLLEGILTFGDISRRAAQISESTFNNPMDDSAVSDVMSCHVESVCHKLLQKKWLQDLEDYREHHPNVVVLDPPEGIQRVHNRLSMLKDVADLKFSDCCGKVGVPRQLVINKDPSSIPDVVTKAGLTLPLVAKPLMVDGSAKSHALSLVYNLSSLSKLDPPLVLQEFINHGGILFKTYIVGEAIKVVRRFSLPDLEQHDIRNHSGVFNFPRVSCAAASADDADLSPSIAEFPPGPLLERFARELRHRLGLRIFNMDIIRERGTTDKYYVIDINYFPGFGKLPGYEQLFTDFLLGFIQTKQS